MSKKITVHLAGIILFIAGFLFMVDVVSPATPIPQAQMQEIRSGLTVLLLLFMTRLVVRGFGSAAAIELFVCSFFLPVLPPQRLTTRLCTLLC